MGCKKRHRKRGSKPAISNSKRNRQKAKATKPKPETCKPKLTSFLPRHRTLKRKLREFK